MNDNRLGNETSQKNGTGECRGVGGRMEKAQIVKGNMGWFPKYRYKLLDFSEK